jgi:hypothetical protein
MTFNLPVTPMNINDPPIVQTPVGLRLVVPKDNDISLTEDQSYIYRVARRYGLQEVLVGGVSKIQTQDFCWLVSPLLGGLSSHGVL